MATINLGVQAQVNDAIRAMGRMNAQFDIMGKVNQDAAGALGVFGVSLTALNNPLTLVAEGLKASIDKSVEWGNTIDDVQKITGQSAEETSKLVTVMGDFGVEAGSLKNAARALKEQGLSPNLDTLKNLAKQYQSIQDPAKRVEWGTKTLGRSFFDLSEILTKTPEEFAAVEKAAQASGKVIGQDFVDDMEQAQIKAKQLQDRLDGLLVKIGPPLIDAVSTAADSFGQLGMIWAAVQIKNQQFLGTIDDEQAALRAAAVAAGDLGAAFTEQEVPALEDVKRGMDDVYTTTVMHSTALETHTGKMEDDAAFSPTYVQALIDQKEKIDDLTGAASDLQFGMGELTTATLFNAAAQGLSKEAAYALAQQMGLINPAADAAKQILDEYTKANDGSKAATEEFTKNVWLLNAAIAALPEGKTITVDYINRYRNEYNADFNQQNRRQGGATGDGYASGTNGWMNVPAGFPNDTYPVRLSSGEKFAVVPPGGKTNNGGDETAMLLRALPALIARSVRDGLLQVAR